MSEIYEHGWVNLKKSGASQCWICKGTVPVNGGTVASLLVNGKYALVHIKCNKKIFESNISQAEYEKLKNKYRFG